MQSDQTALVVHDPPVAGATPSGSLCTVSFDAVYRTEYASLVRLAFVLTGRRDIAEELVQDAFEVAHRRWDRISTYDKPGAWVRRVVLQRCVGRHRRVLAETKALLRLTGRTPDHHELAVRDNGLLVAIRKLPTRQAQVVALICLEDRSVEEVADLLQCAQPTVRTHLRRGRLSLANTLNLTDESDSSSTQESHHEPT
jgi:RNA polymerase sigma-70 factor, ECF subfamily